MTASPTPAEIKFAQSIVDFIAEFSQKGGPQKAYAPTSFWARAHQAIKHAERGLNGCF
jgi:hypothetical protein